MIHLTLTIFVKKGKEAIFHEYEENVLPILNDYGGKLIYRIRPSPADFIVSEGKPPYEIHLLSFTSEQDFIAFGKDERRMKFKEQKEEAISFTMLIKGEEI